MKILNLELRKFLQSDDCRFHFTLAMLVAGLWIIAVIPAWANEAPDIVINVQAQGGDDNFSFSGDLGDFNVATENGEARHILSDLQAGQFKVTTQAPSGWNVLAIMCHSQAASIDFATESVSFDLTSPGRSIPCTFIFRSQ